MRPFLKIIVIALLAVVFGCAMPQVERKVEPPRMNNKWTAYMFYSDPPGAHVYGQDGTYWGQTSESEPIRMDFCGTDNAYYTVTVKKRGYKTVTQGWWIQYKYGSQLEAEAGRHLEKMVILLDPE